MFVVYAIHSPTYDKIYIGYTSNLEQHLLSHNELGKKGWTIKFRPWTIVHTEKIETKPDALKKEKQLKTGKGRYRGAYEAKLIVGLNPNVRITIHRFVYLIVSFLPDSPISLRKSSN